MYYFCTKSWYTVSNKIAMEEKRVFYENELSLLCDTLKKLHINVIVSKTNDLSAAISKIGLDTIHKNASSFVLQFPKDAEPRTIYKFTDSCDLNFLYLLLPDTEVATVLFIGPYLANPSTPERLLELGKKLGVSPLRQSYFDEFYSAIPVLDDKSHFLVLLSSFCERIWQTPSFSIIDVSEKYQSSASPINEPMHTDEFDDILINMKNMEKRYAFENELIRAVSLGQIHKESQLLSAFSENMFEKRLKDPLRNAKNYGVIMNTLLRKAAESGGVHPLYLDRVSSEFAAKIEGMSDLLQNKNLMCEMFRSYCRLVRKHALTHYSLLIQKTILIIDSDISANLSLNSLAVSQNVSPGYLSSTFKKETGKTVTEYIREKRIKHAAFLLATTPLQIQTVALNCGIVDVHYFSKTFKKLIGKTPMEYRNSQKQIK